MSDLITGKKRNRRNKNYVELGKKDEIATKKRKIDEHDDSIHCSICLDDDVKDNVASLDKCIHVFCFDCIKEWAKKSNVCPVCRSRYNKISCTNPKMISTTTEEEEENELMIHPSMITMNVPDRNYTEQQQQTHENSIISRLNAFIHQRFHRDSFVVNRDRFMMNRMRRQQTDFFRRNAPRITSDIHLPERTPSRINRVQPPPPIILTRSVLVRRRDRRRPVREGDVVIDLT